VQLQQQHQMALLLLLVLLLLLLLWCQVLPSATVILKRSTNCAARYLVASVFESAEPSAI
jgi:hypothetical protein